MHKIEILGFVAATLTTMAFVPQVFKAWKERSTTDISLVMYLVMLFGVILWMIYGIYHGSLPITIANAFTAILVFIMVVLKLKYK
ncbi:SemiSWEET transporter [Flavobacteriaceae bacterium F89]|uniref:SemiSWEET transporter n=1 Tax=Cerina litoralis TaxID=2874477 RepID=A0AAE3ETR4_9FLAO|nr:SemiSWEET transporter [Cerina litoralis]MCG2460300.1 SemiSWEET transporter [Cerina litoralis]